MIVAIHVTRKRLQTLGESLEQNKDVVTSENSMCNEKEWAVLEASKKEFDSVAKDL